MGQAKQRGSREQRVALAEAKASERLEQVRRANACRPKESPKLTRSRLLLSAALAAASVK